MTNIDVNIMYDINNNNKYKEKQGAAGDDIDTFCTRLNPLLEKYKTIYRSISSDILSIIDEAHIFMEQSSKSGDFKKLIMPLMEALQSLVESEKNCNDNDGGSN